MPQEPPPVLVVETSFRVPGLGVLVVPVAAGAAQLLAYPLHTSLSISLLLDTHSLRALTATVEELAHEGQPPRRVLLLDFDPGGPLPGGTRLHLAGVLPGLW